jgi:type I restriction enzyme M protein
MTIATGKLENRRVQQLEINGILWAACDAFHGVVSRSEAKIYILAMLLLKYVSDVWLDYYEGCQQQYGDDPERLSQELRKRFVLPNEASFYDLYRQRDASNLGELINKALETIENHEVMLDGVFRHVDFNRGNRIPTQAWNSLLRDLLEKFNKPQLNLRPSQVDEDIVGNACTHLIEQFEGSDGEEFFTPVQVSKLIAQLAKPKSGDSIYDPACGSASLLIRVAEEVKNGNCSLFGQEKNWRIWAIAKMNMLLHGKDEARLECGHTLTNPALTELGQLMKFDVVVSNPPFSLGNWGFENAEQDPYHRFHRGIPPKGTGDYAFISHMIESALPLKGKVVVIAPHGVLFRGGSESKIRQQLIKENLLDAVIGLPSQLLPSTSIPIVILVFDRSREKEGKNQKRKDILFIDASEKHAHGRVKNTLLDEHISHIVKVYDERKNVNDYAHVATLDEIEKNDFNLSIFLYVDRSEDAKTIDITVVQREINQLESQLTEVRSEMANSLKQLGIEVATGDEPFV